MASYGGMPQAVALHLICCGLRWSNSPVYPIAYLQGGLLTDLFLKLSECPTFTEFDALGIPCPGCCRHKHEGVLCCDHDHEYLPPTRYNVGAPCPLILPLLTYRIVRDSCPAPPPTTTQGVQSCSGAGHQGRGGRGFSTRTVCRSRGPHLRTCHHT